MSSGCNLTADQPEDAETERGDAPDLITNLRDQIAQRDGRISELRQALSLARSMILSGEAMTPTAQTMIDRALGIDGSSDA